MNDIKLAVLGSEGVGKSALIVRFLTRRFIGEYASLSECIYRKRLTLDGRQLNVELYDPCSQGHQGRSALSDQLQWGDGFVVIYDISDRASFQAARNTLQLIRELQHPGPGKRDAEASWPVFLVGNKQDLCHMREVRREEGARLAADLRCGGFFELSAAEPCQEVALMFSKVLQSVCPGGKGAKDRRRRPSGSKSMAKLITNVFGKRRKSV